MSSTMLQLVQQVTNELGVTTPAVVAGSPNQDVIQILALMNASGYELLRRADWQQLVHQEQFSTEYLTTTGDWTTAARTITNIPSTAGLDTTYQVVGTGISNATYIESVDSSTQVTVNQDFTEAGGTSATVDFQKVKYDLPSDYLAMIPRTQ